MAEESGSVSTKLGTVIMKSDVAGTALEFPVDLELSISTSVEGAKINILAEVGLASLQASFDSIAKSLPMPNDTSGYGIKTVAHVESASLSASGDTAVVEANINATVWEIAKGLPGGGATIRYEVRCINLLVGEACSKWPVSVETPPGDDVKLKLLTEGLNGRVALSLATPDGVSIEMRPGPAIVTPRGDIGRFFNDVAGIFDYNLSSRAQIEIGEIVNDGNLRQALPAEILAFNPTIAGVQFMTRLDGSLGAKVDFHANITTAQLTEWIQNSISKP